MGIIPVKFLGKIPLEAASDPEAAFSFIGDLEGTEPAIFSVTGNDIVRDVKSAVDLSPKIVAS